MSCTTPMPSREGRLNTFDSVQTRQSVSNDGTETRIRTQTRPKPGLLTEPADIELFVSNESQGGSYSMRVTRRCNGRSVLASFRACTVDDRLLSGPEVDASATGASLDRSKDIPRDRTADSTTRTLVTRTIGRGAPRAGGSLRRRAVKTDNGKVAGRRRQSPRMSLLGYRCSPSFFELA